MDNQHREIKGYRHLSQEEIMLINNVKSLGADIDKLIEELRRDDDVDQRWLAIGKTDLQKGFMAIIRAVAKPETF